MNSDQWLTILARECARTSQARVARELGVSAAMVNQVLKGRYSGNIATIKTRVAGALMGATVNCPVLGEISVNACLDHQTRPFAPTNAQRVRLYKACLVCPNNRSTGGE